MVDRGDEDSVFFRFIKEQGVTGVSPRVAKRAFSLVIWKDRKGQLFVRNTGKGPGVEVLVELILVCKHASG